MKKIIIASIFVAVSMFSVSVSAGDIKLPLDSARSDVRPNNQKKVDVVERVDLTRPSASKSGTMTVEQLVSNRPTIASGASGGSKLCTTDGSTCVSAENNPATIKIATFKHGTGPAKNERTVAWKEFNGQSASIPADGVTNLDCQVKNGKSTGNCRIASSNE